MRRAFKFRLCPNANQARELGIMLETHRRLYNEFLAQRKDVYDREKKTLKSAEQSRWYTDAHGIRATNPNPYYRRLNRQSVQGLLKRLDRAFQAFFRRVKAGEKPGYPRFKGRDRFDGFESLNYGQSFGFQLNGSRLDLRHVGSIKVKLHREIRGKVKTVSIKREADKWYVVFSCDLGPIEVPPSLNPAIGIDLGLSAYLTTNEGEKVANPRHLKAVQAELRCRQRSVSRKKLRGRNRRKAVRRLQVIHARTANIRKEFHHQEALKLVRRFGFIAVEALDVKGMLEDRGAFKPSEKRRLNRSISDAAWGGFVSTLKCKAESAGVSIVEVDPRGTTQQCSGCGRTVPKTLRNRWHQCPHCGLSLDRDENAARNVYQRGINTPEGQAYLARVLTARIGPAGRNVGHRAVRAPRSHPSSPVLSVTDPTPCSPEVGDLPSQPLIPVRHEAELAARTSLNEVNSVPATALPPRRRSRKGRIPSDRQGTLNFGSRETDGERACDQTPLRDGR